MNTDRLQHTGQDAIPDVAVIVLTCNRRDELLRTLGQLAALPERPHVCVVDNGSEDGTADAVRTAYPDMQLLALPRNIGAAARNLGAFHVDVPFVAFCDDDTWWAPGALSRAATMLRRHPELAAVTARILVGAAQVEDSASARMSRSPLPNELGVAGSAVLGLMAGACMMRRTAFLEAGGYCPRLFIGGEEALLAMDLRSAGWHMAYAPDVVVHHFPSVARDVMQRQRILLRNRLWCAWLRRPVLSAWRECRRVWGEAAGSSYRGGALLDALRGLPWVCAARRVIPAHVEAALRLVTAYYAAPAPPAARLMTAR